jgi:NAD(P)H-flavin reductase
MKRLEGYLTGEVIREVLREHCSEDTKRVAVVVVSPALADTVMQLLAESGGMDAISVRIMPEGDGSGLDAGLDFSADLVITDEAAVLGRVHIGARLNVAYDELPEPVFDHTPVWIRQNRHPHGPVSRKGGGGKRNHQSGTSHRRQR